MAFIVDAQELKPGLILFRLTDVKHHNWYCRIRLPNAERYKTISLKTAHLNEARDKAALATFETVSVARTDKRMIMAFVAFKQGLSLILR